MTQPPLLVGSESDAHLRVVAEKLRERSVSPVVFDADSVARIGYCISPDRLTIGGRTIADGGRAWLRRLAVRLWGNRVPAGSIEDVSFRARVQLITAIARHGHREWITDIDALPAAEDRIHQLAVARRLEIATPPTVVTTDPAEIEPTLGHDTVLKPLTIAAFIDSDGQPQGVHVTKLDKQILKLGDFSAAPFVVQTRIDVWRHLRVVTAGSTVRTAALEADGRPLDWRTAEESHHAWREHPSPEVETQALRLASELGVGLSSQDWLVPVSGPPMFIDLNPAGQWMFLPDSVADPITESVVSFLCGDL